MVRPSALALLFLAAPLVSPLTAHAASPGGTLGTLPAVSASANDRPVTVADAAPPAGSLLSAPPALATAAPVDASTGPLLPGPDAPPLAASTSRAAPVMPAMPVAAVTAEKTAALLPPVPPAKPAIALAAAPPAFSAPPASVVPIETAMVGHGPAEGIADLPAGPRLTAAGPALSPPLEKGETLIARSATGDAAALPPPAIMANAAPPGAAPPRAAQDAPVIAEASREAAPGPHGFHRLRAPPAEDTLADADDMDDQPVGTVVAPRAHRVSESEAVANIEAIENGGRPDDADVAPVPHAVYRRAAADCRNYTRRTGGGLAAGTACLDAGGMWRIVAEHPLRGLRRPIVTASLE